MANKTIKYASLAGIVAVTLALGGCSTIRDITRPVDEDSAYGPKDKQAQNMGGVAIGGPIGTAPEYNPCEEAYKKY